MAAKLAVRLNTANPNHHLWNNNGTWWLHYTVHLPNYTKERVRLSLRTAAAEQARKERDRILQSLGGGELEAAGEFGCSC